MTASRTRKTKAATEPRLSPRKAPENMQVDDWQRALRRQFGREQVFLFDNLGDEPVFSEFRVRNPDSGGSYRVRIRGLQPGDNHCTCLDFRTNDLGTCKHIEFVLARLEKKRGAKAALKRGYRPPYSELFLQPGNPRSLRLSSGCDIPDVLLEQVGDLFRLDRQRDGTRYLLDPERVASLAYFISSCAKSCHELRIDEAALDYLAGLRDAERRRETLAKVFPQGAASPALAKLVKVPLYAYQAEGALFAVAAGRALIGDDMGLGKTVQAITAAEIFARHFGVRRVLVICPTSLKYQWQREIERFPGRQARVVEGGQKGAQRDF